MAELVISTAAGSVLLRVDLDEREKFTIGRGDRCDIRLRGVDVARFHAVLYQERDTWNLIDLTMDIDEGLWLDDRRVRCTALVEDRPVRMGQAFLWAFDLPRRGRHPLPARLPAEPVMLRNEYIEQLWQSGILRAEPGEMVDESLTSEQFASGGGSDATDAPEESRSA